MVTEDENYSPDYSRESKNISKEIREVAHGKHHNRLQDCNKNHDCNTLNTQVQGKQGGECVSWESVAIPPYNFGILDSMVWGKQEATE